MQIIHALTLNDKENKIFNIGSEKGISLLSLAKSISEECDAELILTSKEIQRDSKVIYYVLDMSKLYSYIDCSPTKPLSFSIQEMVRTAMEINYDKRSIMTKF